MLQVEIFVDDDPGPLRKDINEWLMENRPDVVFVTQSEGDDGAGNWGMSICIWYKEEA